MKMWQKNNSFDAIRRSDELQIFRILDEKYVVKRRLKGKYLDLLTEKQEGSFVVKELIFDGKRTYRYSLSTIDKVKFM